MWKASGSACKSRHRHAVRFGHRRAGRAVPGPLSLPGARGARQPVASAHPRSGIVLGTALYLLHVEATILTSLPVIGSTAALVAGHILIVIPWSVRLVTASLAGFDRSIEEAAQNLGATPTRTFFRITLPMIRPGIVAAALFGFVVSFGNLEMSMFLVGAGRTTLPIAILQYLEYRIDPPLPPSLSCRSC